MTLNLISKFGNGKDLPNNIVIQKRGSDFQQLIVLNSKECQLLLDKTDINASWDLLCKSVAHRSGIIIQDGNWELVSQTVMGETRPLH